MIRVGLKVPNDGELPSNPGIIAMSQLAEESGFASIWTTDHIVTPRTVDSAYGFTSNAKHDWGPSTPWFDSLVTAATMAAVTKHVEVGTAILVAPLREPIATAKQIASIDALSDGRFICGLGAGWMAEEYKALSVDFASRGARLDEWIDLAQQVWSGEPDLHEGQFYNLSVHVSAYPKPRREVPVLIGGLSKAALRRAGARGGWVGHTNLSTFDPHVLEKAVATIYASAEAHGNDKDLRITTRIGESAGQAEATAQAIRQCEALGIHDVIIDVDWTDFDSVRRDAEILLA